MSNTFGIDLGTCNVKVFCKATGKVLNEKNTIAIVNKNQMYAYGDQAYAMYEKAPENINVTFPVINGVIADYANMQTMISTSRPVSWLWISEQIQQRFPSCH